MPNIFRGAQAQVNRSDLSGRRVWKGVSTGVIWGTWFDHFWQAKGAADYATSLLDLVGAQNLVEGNGAVPWAGGAGWGFVAAQLKYFDTGLVPTNDQSWSMLVQFSPTAANAAAFLAGMQHAGVGRRMALFIDNVPAHRRAYSNGGQIVVNNAVVAANMAIAGNQGYWNGLADGAPVGVWTIVPTRSIYIGCYNNGVAALFVDAEIIALGIKKGPALTAPQVAAAAAAMALI